MLKNCLTNVYLNAIMDSDIHEENYVLSDILFLEKMHGDVIMDYDLGYPCVLKSCFGGKRPTALFCMGRKELLDEPMILICGARDASEGAIKLARKCGLYAVGRGYTVASGYARGVDRAAHLGALEAGGSTVAFLPFGLSRFRVSCDIADEFDPERFCVVSEVPPGYGFTAQSAFRRNKFLVALSEAVIVIEPGDGGGSWYTAERAAWMRKPLFFLEGSRLDVVGKMAPLGGIRLQVKKGVPDLDPVYEQCAR